MARENIAGRPDSMIIEPDHIISSRRALGESDLATAMEDLSSREPALAGYISESMASLAGKLALSGAPTPLVQGLYNEALALVVSSIEAQRRAHFDLYMGTVVGTRLEALMGTPKAGPDAAEQAEPVEPVVAAPKPARKPRKRRKDDAE